MPRSQPTSGRVAGLQFVNAASPPVTTTPRAAETNRRGRDRTMRSSEGGRRISRFPVCIASALARIMREHTRPLTPTLSLSEGEGAISMPSPPTGPNGGEGNGVARASRFFRSGLRRQSLTPSVCLGEDRPLGGRLAAVDAPARAARLLERDVARGGLGLLLDLRLARPVAAPP